MEINHLTSLVIQLCLKIHSKTGPGCFEKVYEEILCYELCRSGLEFKRQLIFPIFYEQLLIEGAYKLDLLIENCVVVELKSIFPLPPIFFNQLRTQLFLCNLKHGMLINFKVSRMKHGIHRVFNNRGADFLKQHLPLLLYPLFPSFILLA